jgi:hypothetical protein
MGRLGDWGIGRLGDEVKTQASCFTPAPRPLTMINW